MKKIVTLILTLIMLMSLVGCGGVAFFKEDKRVPTPNSLFHEIKYDSEVGSTFQSNTTGSVPMKWKVYRIKADSEKAAKEIYENYLKSLSEDYNISLQKGYLSTPIDNFYTLLLDGKEIGVVSYSSSGDAYGMSMTFDVPTRDDFNNDKTDRQLSKDEAESRALSALYRAISEKEGYYLCDAGQTRYDIATANRGSSGWTFKGTVSLYDSYGQFRYRGTFDITIYDSGRDSCDLNIQK